MAETSSASPAKVGPYRTLDAWRGLAALSVVLFHWGEMVVYGNSGLANNPLYAACSFGYLGVQIFFVISGYCIASAAMSTVRRGESPKAFMLARVRRIYPAYWAGLVLTLAFYCAGYLLVKRGLLHANIYTQANPLSGPWIFYFANGSLTMGWLHQPELLAVAWTLSYEIAFYLIFAILLWLLSAIRKANHLLTALHALTVASLIWLIADPGSCPFPLNMWPQFGFGILVYDLTAHPARRLPKVLAAVTLALLVLFVSRYDMPWVMGQPTRLTFLVAAGFAALLTVLYRFDRRMSDISLVKVVALCGTFSYSLYLTQVVSLRLLNQATTAVHFPHGLHLVLLPIAVAFAIAAAYAFYLLFERPFLKRGKRVEPPPPGAKTPASPPTGTDRVAEPKGRDSQGLMKERTS